jgi:hypothetical protein
MIKTLAAAAIASAIAIAAPATQAEAKTNINIGVGLDFGGGGYYPGYYEPYPVYEPRHVYRGGCGYAREAVRDQGFHKVRPLDCSGSRFAFKARRHGDWWLVTTSRSGSIRSVRPL